jgi:hypothetical protein
MSRTVLSENEYRDSLNPESSAENDLQKDKGAGQKGRVSMEIASSISTCPMKCILFSWPTFLPNRGITMSLAQAANCSNPH